MTAAQIATAMLERYASGVQWGAGFAPDGECVIQCAMTLGPLDRAPFYRAFALAAGVQAASDGLSVSIARWNDQPERTADEVKAALKRVAGVA